MTESELFVELLRTHGALIHAVTALFRQHGLTEPQYNVLRILRGAGPEGLSCQAVAERMITRAPDITRLIDRLVAARLVTRTRDKHDRRIVRLTNRKRALELLERLDGPVRKLHTRQLGHLSRDEQQELAALLARARQEVEK